MFDRELLCFFLPFLQALTELEKMLNIRENTELRLNRQMITLVSVS